MKRPYFSTSRSIHLFLPASARNGILDGLRVARLLFQYNIGCREEKVLHLKKVNGEFLE